MYEMTKILIPVSDNPNIKSFTNTLNIETYYNNKLKNVSLMITK